MNSSHSTSGARVSPPESHDFASPWPVRTAVLAGGLFVAVGLFRNPALTVAAMVAFIAVSLGLLIPVRLQKSFLVALAVLLTGYAFFGRGFAHFGAAPFYVGEIVLGLGLAAMVPTAAFRPAFRQPVAWVYVAFAIWGLARTIPFLGTYGVDALRDAALWGYGVFMILVAACIFRLGEIPRALAFYRRFLPWIIAWIPLGMVISKVASGMVPPLPGSDVSFLNVKPGDYAVHLAGAAAFLLLGLHRLVPGENVAGAAPRQDRGHRDWLLWLVWVTGFVLTSLFGRGGMLAVLTSLMIVSAMGVGWRWLRSLLKPLALALFLVGTVALFNIEFDVGAGRKISLEQLGSNIESILGGQDEQNLEATENWRQQWWSDIIDYTMFGDYFWDGKGYGINLELDDGYVATRDASSRAPHNAHLDILARSGVPGFALWLLLLGLFAGGLISAYLRARARGDVGWARVNVWIFAYWVAFLVNGSFDTYLEGPQGGIWFWSLMGLGVAAMEVQRRERGGFA